MNTQLESLKTLREGIATLALGRPGLRVLADRPV